MLIDKDGENRVSVQDVLLELRKYRMGLIQTHDQLTFSYEAIIEGTKRMNNDVSNIEINAEIPVNKQTSFLRHSTNWTIWRSQQVAIKKKRTHLHHCPLEPLHA